MYKKKDKKLKSLEEYLKNEEATKKYVIELENQLKDLKIKHTEELYIIGKNHLFDKDRLKNEMKTKLNELGSEFRHLFYDRMRESTKKLLKENVFLNSKINSLTDTLQNVYKENKRLKSTVILNFFAINSLIY